MRARIALVALVAATLVVALTAFTAPPTKGKVVSADERSVKIALAGEKPDWIVVGAPVKFPDGVGKVLEVSPEGKSPVVVTVKTKKAPEMKAGDAVSFEKGKASSGC